MSAIKPDFYIGVIKNPPSLVSIGKTIDGMEVIDVVLNSELNEDKKRDFENAINKIGPAKPPMPSQAPVVEEAAPKQIETPVVEEAAPEQIETPVVEEAAPKQIETPVAPEQIETPVVEEAAPEQIETPQSHELTADSNGNQTNQPGGGKKTKRNKNKRRRTKRRKTKRSKK